MTNVIPLPQNNEQQMINELTVQIAKIENEIEQDKQKIFADKQLAMEIAILEAGAPDRKSKAPHINARKALEANIKLLNNSVDAKEKMLQNIKTKLGIIKQGLKQEFVASTSKERANKVFIENNIHYVIYDQQWWSVDPAGDRMSVKINHSKSDVIKDLIYHDSRWKVVNDQDLKELAEDLGRVYKHIVRDFEKDRPDVYNQMATIRNQWLKPIHGVKPHDAFRVLMLSIAGGDEDYADQIEKWVAYRYCHPSDVMIPNIDSCAIGGTGRDTFYNMLRVIFTDECCGSVGVETFKGTHNGDLFGKMIIKVDEKDSHSIPIDRFKELTGSTRYRHRAMNMDARDVARLFTFILFRNGFTTTIKLAGTGSSGEDRRTEPVIARVNLPRHVALYHNLINNLTDIPDSETIKAMTILIKEWQRDFYKKEERIQEWLGYIIDKYNAYQMTELLPLHGKYYTEMLQRQKKGVDGFMPKIVNLMHSGSSNVININQAHKLYEIAESQKCTKDWFKNQMMYWLNVHEGWDSEELMDNIYTWEGCTDVDRRKMVIVQNKLTPNIKRIFDINDFIDRDALDDKGTTVGEKINVWSLRDELR